MMRILRSLFLITGVATVLAGSIHWIGSAQSTDIWSPAINLSQSGAASQPRLVATPAGDLQVFWWDAFDGLMTIVGQLDAEAGEYTWSVPRPAPISSEYLINTPALVIDADGVIHAFWTESVRSSEAVNTETQASPPPPTKLMHSEMTFGNSIWAYPDLLAESIAGYSIVTPRAGGVTVAYIRNRHTPDAPAGVYVKQNNAFNKGWGASKNVYSSTYYRLIAFQEGQISVVGNREAEMEGDHPLYLAWFDPRQEQLLFSNSNDGGDTWNEAQAIGNSEWRPKSPRLVDIGKLGLIWQASAQGGCELYQQEIKPDDSELPADQKALEWESPKSILEDLAACPSVERFLISDTSKIWLWNEGTSNLAISMWDELQAVWSQRLILSFTFENEKTEQAVNLNELNAALSDDNLYIVGSDITNGEIWFTQADFNSLKFTLATPTPWDIVQQVSAQEVFASIPAIAIDDQENVHLVWDQGAEPAKVNHSLYYAHSTGGKLSQPVEILPSATGEISRQPSLLYHSINDSLHLVWSGGKDGVIFHSWSSASDAGSPNSWSTPQRISAAGAAASPQIGQDNLGELYILYTVPFNENRGVYMVHSSDFGKTWSDPITVFYAANSNWPMVTHPTLAVSSDGVIHAAWVQSQLPDLEAPLGVFYSRSIDHGLTWTPILSMTGRGYDWPRLLLSGGKVHLLFASSENGKGSLYHRWAELNQDTENSSSWSIPLSIPGWREIELPYGASNTGPEDGSSVGIESMLHLVGTDSSTSKLRYSKWDGQQWSITEEVSAFEQIRMGLGVNAASPRRGGILVVGWLAVPYINDHDQPTSLFLTSREIPSYTLPTPITATSSQLSTPTITSILIPEPTITLTPTPDLNAITSSKSNAFPLPPLTVGGILAAIVVAGIFTARFVYTRTRDRSP